MATDLDRQIKALNKKFTDIEKKIIPKAKTSALNKTTRRIKTQVVRVVSKQAAIKPKIIRKKFYIKKATPLDSRASVTMYRSSVAAISLNPRTVGGARSPKGVKFGRRHERQAFMANGMSSYSKGILRGRPQVLERMGKANYPLDVVKVEIKDQVNSALPYIAKYITKNELPKFLEQEISWRLKKLEGK